MQEVYVAGVRTAQRPHKDLVISAGHPAPCGIKNLTEDSPCKQPGNTLLPIGTGYTCRQF